MDMIPDEAVEAAARSAYAVYPAMYYGSGSAVAWEQLSDSRSGQRRKNHELKKARIALEAVAPRMLAGAWDAGHESGFWNGRGSNGDVTGMLIGVEHAKENNPYR